MFAPPPPPEDEAPDPVTEVTLCWTRATGPDLWTEARRVERAMNLQGRPEALAYRPRRRTPAELAMYRWYWPGDERDYLVRVMRDLLPSWADQVSVTIEFLPGFGETFDNPTPPATPPEPPVDPPVELDDDAIIDEAVRAAAEEEEDHED